MRDWNSQARNREARLARAAHLARGKRVPAGDAGALLEAVLEPGDRVCLEGNNQKQADFLARPGCRSTPARVHDLHMVQSVLALPEHLDVFERGIAAKLDFSFSGPQGARLAKLVGDGRIEVGAIHTYLELFGRYFVDLTPQVAWSPRRPPTPPATSTPAPTPRTRRPSSRPPPSSAASSSPRSTRSSTRCRASTSPATGSTSSCRPAARTTSSRCSPAIRRRSPRSRC